MPGAGQARRDAAAGREGGARPRLRPPDSARGRRAGAARQQTARRAQGEELQAGRGERGTGLTGGAQVGSGESGPARGAAALPVPPGERARAAAGRAAAAGGYLASQRCKARSAALRYGA